LRSPYLVCNPDFVACHVPAYLDKYDMLKGLKRGGTFLLNSIWDVEETKKHLPNNIKRYLALNDINFYIINASLIAEEIGLPGRTNTIMQSAFFKVTNIIPYEVAVKDMKEAIEKTYGKKGEDVVKKNFAAIDAGSKVIKVEIPQEWKNLPVEEVNKDDNLPEFIKNVMIPIFRLKVMNYL
jgi:pyruvate-ferredoxin/flavodoxin oxidoreductase